MLTPITGGAVSSQLALGPDSSFALATSGALWSWGGNAFGTLGNGQSGGAQPIPAVVNSQSWVHVASGDHACAIDSSSNLYCWGRNENGQLGTGGTAEPAQPTPIPQPATSTWTAIATGIEHSCGINQLGTFCWGLADTGQLGNGVTSQRNFLSPQQLKPSVIFVDVTCGGYYTCALANDQHAWCWGSGIYGQLGVGGIGVIATPTQVNDATWRALAAGYYHTCGIQSDGSLWCWGLNDNGQLGDGSLESRDTPTQVGDPNDHTWTAVAAGAAHSCATRSDGTMWCWGSNLYGQLGDGTAWRAQLAQVP
jgi:alpha-tubulin suppressor-like RCC1 family protein